MDRGQRHWFTRTLEIWYILRLKIQIVKDKIRGGAAV